MSETVCVSSEVDGNVALVTLQRPEALNALNQEMMEQFVDALTRADADESIRAVVIAGSQRAFCVGADVKELISVGESHPLVADGFGRRFFELLGHYRKPLVAAVRGLALGGGCEVALACDIVVASQSALFGLPEVTLGVIPGAGGTQRIMHALGKAKAMYLLLSGEPISAEEALGAGLVTRVVADEECVSSALGMAKRIAINAPRAVQMAKDAALHAYETSLAQGLEYERRNFHLLLRTSDMREGIEAFVQKRKPVFTGH
ncbi:MAG: enoyl-CoA hydratase/isomerase family protein [Ferrimicrobium sp.]